MPLPITDTVICNTSHLSIIKINGDDAQAFLQGQFSNDVALLKDGDTQLNSYNSPKGRMYAAFRLCYFDASYFMLLPKEITATVLKRLKMFVMRSNVTLEDVSEQWKTLGLSGEGIDEALNNLPENINISTQPGKKHFVKLSSEHNTGEQRILVVGIESEIVDLRIALEKTIPLTQSEHWLRLDIHAGIPNIYANTMESFVAQMINFQLVNGVSFTKGCYPGQEVVARMHYLGKLKKRMYRVTLNCPAKPDDKIFDASGDNEQSIGQIVDAQENENGGFDALAVLQIKAAEANKLKLESLAGETLNVETLPYDFPADKE